MGTRIRVMRIIARMNVGGPALQITGLMRGLDRERYEQRFYVGQVGETEEDFLRLRAPDIEHSIVPGLGRSIALAGDFQAFGALREEMRSFQPHIVHTHTAKAGVLGRIAALTSGVEPALVHTFHGHLLHGYFPPPVTAAVSMVERTLARKTDLLLSVGGQVRDELLAAGVGRPEQYVVMPPGIGIAAPPDRNGARSKLLLPQDAPVLAFVGRLTQVKRPLRFLEVVRGLQPRHPNLHALIVGGGPLSDEVKVAARAMGDRVRLLGWRGDVETIYAASDLAVLTSDNEGMPVSLIEAAMCGIPAVTTDVGSAREVVEDGSTGYVRGSVRSLVEAVDILLSDHERRAAFGRAACQRSHALFGTARLVADTESVYERFLS